VHGGRAEGGEERGRRLAALRSAVGGRGAAGSMRGAEERGGGRHSNRIGDFFSKEWRPATVNLWTRGYGPYADGGCASVRAWSVG
jgi:hypothetical protein